MNFIRACKYGPFANLEVISENQENNQNGLNKKYLQKNKKKTLVFEEDEEENSRIKDLIAPSNTFTDKESQPKFMQMNQSSSKVFCNSDQSDVDMLVPVPNNFDITLINPSISNPKHDEGRKPQLGLNSNKKNIISKLPNSNQIDQEIIPDIKVIPFETFKKIPIIEYQHVPVQEITLKENDKLSKSEKIESVFPNKIKSFEGTDLGID